MNIMTTKIAKHTILGLALLGLFGCASARAQIALQDGSTNKIISNSGSSSISTNFTVTSGASVLVVSLYDRNNVASESAPASRPGALRPSPGSPANTMRAAPTPPLPRITFTPPPPARKPSPPRTPRGATSSPWRCRSIRLTASAPPIRPRFSQTTPHTPPT